jgi:hypothetical protein
VVDPVSWGLLDRCFPNYGPVPSEDYCCSAESVCDSAVFPDERESAAGQLKSPIWEDKPHSHTPTLRYDGKNTSLREPIRSDENTFGVQKMTEQFVPLSPQLDL